jgi:hypothetical protein
MMKHIRMRSPLGTSAEKSLGAARTSAQLIARVMNIERVGNVRDLRPLLQIGGQAPR